MQPRSTGHVTLPYNRERFSAPLSLPHPQCRRRFDQRRGRRSPARHDAAREEARFAAESFGADTERGGYDYSGCTFEIVSEDGRETITVPAFVRRARDDLASQEASFGNPLNRTATLRDFRELYRPALVQPATKFPTSADNESRHWPIF